MNQKDGIIRAYAHDYRDMTMDEIELAVLLARFSTEIIEKLIEEIPDTFRQARSMDSLEGIQSSVEVIIDLKQFKQRLRKDWL